MPLVLLALACATSATSPDPQPATAPGPAAAVDLDDPATCSACHAAVVREWNDSMHARAHHDRDPIHAGMRRMRMAKQGQAIAGQCAQCHTPRSPADVDAPAAKQGVSCATCHAAAHVDLAAGKGAKALTWTEGTLLLGPHDLAAGASPVHGTGNAPAHLTDGTTLCMACHDATTTPTGADACTTGPEFRAAAATEGEAARSCVACHMPRVEGPSGAVSTRADHASHRFHGPHDAWHHDDPSFLAQAVDLRLTRAPSGTATVTLANRSQHGFPTGFPGRMAVLVVEGFDAAGASVWRADDTVLNKVYVDGDGKPVPPPFSAKLDRDTRLTPNETRTLQFEPPATVASLEARLVLRLLPPPMASSLGLPADPATAELAEPRLVASASWSPAPTR